MIERFEAKISHFYGTVWACGIPVSLDIASKVISPDHRRVICQINKTIKTHSGLIPDGQGSYYIGVNKANRELLGVDLGDTVSVELQKDESKYGMEMPEELEELLLVDPEGEKYFETLTPGKQRNLIHLVSKPKTSHTRLKKAVGILDYLKSSSGRLDFKELQQFFRDMDPI